MSRSLGTTDRKSPEFVFGHHDRDHTVPSVEVSFSDGSPSSGRFTPTSSQDGTTDAGLDEPDRQSTVPITQSLFENLRLDGSIERGTGQMNGNATDSPISFRLTPRRTATTYRDLHNVSPSPNVRFDDQSDQQPRTPSSPSASRPGTVPVHLENLTLGDSDEDIETEEDYRGDAEAGNGDFLYNIRQEELPRVPVYNLGLQNALREVKRRLTDLVEVMRNSELIHDHETALCQLYGQCLEASRFKYPETRTVGFIGDSGAGRYIFSTAHRLYANSSKGRVLSSTHFWTERTSHAQ